MRNEVTEIRRPRSLVNEDAVAERDFDLSQWITWVIGLYVLGASVSDAWARGDWLL